MYHFLIYTSYQCNMYVSMSVCLSICMYVWIYGCEQQIVPILSKIVFFWRIHVLQLEQEHLRNLQLAH